MIQLPLELTDLDVVVDITGPGNETRDESVEEMEDRKKNEEAEDSGIDAVEEIQERRDSEVADDSGVILQRKLKTLMTDLTPKLKLPGRQKGRRRRRKPDSKFLFLYVHILCSNKINIWSFV